MRLTRGDLDNMSKLLEERSTYDYHSQREGDFFPSADKAQGNAYWHTMVLGMVAAINPTQLKAFAEHHLNPHDDLYKKGKQRARQYMNQVGDDQKAYQKIVEMYGDQIREALQAVSREPWSLDEFNEEPAEEQEEHHDKGEEESH